MDRYEVMAGKMAPLTDGAHRKWGFTGKVETRSYERLVDALIDFVETGDSLKARFLTGFAACLAADRKSVENRGFGVAVRKVQCHRGEDGTVRVSSVETMHERRYTVDDWRYDTAHREQTENGIRNRQRCWNTSRETSILDIPCPKRRKNMRWIPLAVFGRMNEGIRKGALLF